MVDFNQINFILKLRIYSRHIIIEVTCVIKFGMLQKLAAKRYRKCKNWSEQPNSEYLITYTRTELLQHWHGLVWGCVYEGSRL